MEDPFAADMLVMDSIRKQCTTVNSGLRQDSEKLSDQLQPFP